MTRTVKKRLEQDAYTVGWLCPLEVEMSAARYLLDEEHHRLSSAPGDPNQYILGQVYGYNVVIASLPAGYQGTVSAAAVAIHMGRTFPSLSLRLLVGIGGGVPSKKSDIRLGDVVVGIPAGMHGGVVEYDLGKQTSTGFERKGFLSPPPTEWLQAVTLMKSDHRIAASKASAFLDKMLERYPRLTEYKRPSPDQDVLFEAGYDHIRGQDSCDNCDQTRCQKRAARDSSDEPVVHYGLIASGNQVMKNATERDRISRACGGVLCFEMEAAGLMNDFSCIVIRGISDYADSHKNDDWHAYAAAAAAALAKELLSYIESGVAARHAIKNTKEVTEAPWLVPFTRNQSFVGRQAHLERLDTNLSSEYCQPLAICGLGGSGKTALALEFACRTRERQPKRAVFWVPAFSRESFERAYRDIGVLLQIPGIADDNTDVKELVRDALSKESAGWWLMIVDNADDVDVLLSSLNREADADSLIDYLPQARKGSVIFTTRTREAAIDLAEGNVIELSELNKSDAHKILEKRLLRKDLVEDDGVDEFLKALAYLPLAIIQAVAFINKKGITISNYMSLYRRTEENATDLLSKDFRDQSRYRDTKNPVAITWFISFDLIRKNNALAAEYLSLIACTTGENIPRSLLLPGSSEIAQAQAIGTLKAYAFITERQRPEDLQDGEEEEEAFDVHQLVLLAIRNWLKGKDEWHHWTGKALARLVDIIPHGDHQRRDVWAAYLPHAIHVVGIPELAEEDSKLSLLDRIGKCQKTLGQYKASEVTHRELLALREKALGKEHPATLTSMADLGVALRLQGKYEEAVRVNRDTLALSEKVLGKEHPSTLKRMNNLGLALYSQEKYTEAERIYRETIALKEVVLGKEHLSTLTAVKNLALVLYDQGKYSEAEKKHREILAVREKVLGREHPSTLMSMIDLGTVLWYQGKHAEAERVHQETLTLRQKVLGKEHPDTLASMKALALVLRRQGKEMEAEALLRETLLLREKVLGKEHPSTIRCMQSLGASLRIQGMHAEAEEMYRGIVTLYGKTLGKEHHTTIRCMHTLGALLLKQGKGAEAEKILQETVTLSEKVLGKKHTVTLRCKNDLGLALNL